MESKDATEGEYQHHCPEKVVFSMERSARTGGMAPVVFEGLKGQKCRAECSRGVQESGGDESA